MADSEGTPGRKVTRYTSKKELAKRVGFSSTKEYDQWVDSDLFTDHFDQLYESVIVPKRNEASAQGRARTREMNLVTVEAALAEGESHGKRKYSVRRPKKENWQTHDHYALAIYLLRKENTESFHGIFYESDISDKEKQEILWAILVFRIWEMSPSRVAKRQAGAKKRAEVEAKRAARQQSRKDKRVRRNERLNTLRNASETPLPSIEDEDNLDAIDSDLATRELTSEEQEAL